MQPTKYDSFLLVFLLVVFLYCFFVVGGSDPVYDARGEVVSIEYPTALFIVPPLFLFIFLLNVFKDELRDVSIRSSLGKVKTKIRFYILRRRYT